MRYQKIEFDNFRIDANDGNGYMHVGRNRRGANERKSALNLLVRCAFLRIDLVEWSSIGKERCGTFSCERRLRHRWARRLPKISQMREEGEKMSGLPCKSA